MPTGTIQQEKGPGMSSHQQENDRKSSRRPRRVRRGIATAALALVTAAVGLVAPNSASAAPLAFECDSGDVCVWNATNGTGNRCSWTNADPDWWSGSVQCSWSDTQNVRSGINRGTSSAYRAVAFYSGANYTGTLVGCLRQNGERDGQANVRVRSHKWVASATC
ncbi:peptidase inhibitor family I36 protein [Streptomyces sp. 11x1]|uniref:peptidase inhibitor family I36 protein n=1 Tax=Streptomyces sp. 11x1 TaxID=3038642 RepID=UPI00292DADA4|nr:peptidase inhibitor family I36 protein [Streptomyces sp. 11x1]WNZ07881.1 peptidase inhibitor family I36 protein [Streptomyces sp. 11x1]